MSNGLPGGKILTSSDGKDVLIANPKAPQNQTPVDSSLKKQKKKKRKPNDENSDLLTVRHLESTIENTLSKKLKETSLVTGNNSSSPSSENQASPKKKSKKKPKTTISTSALPKLTEERDKKASGEQVVEGDLQSEIIDSKYRKFGAQRATEQSNLINLQQVELESKGIRNQFNPALRWEYALSDIDKEKNRIEEYKQKRRERYYAHLGMEAPKTCQESSKDVEFVFA